MRTNPSEAERRRRMASFHLADTDGSGKLDLEEFVSAAELLGLEGLDRPSLEEHFHAADVNENDLMEIEEYASMIEKLTSKD
jgi:Ca2+-binding EF-hand superfamily protein